MGVGAGTSVSDTVGNNGKGYSITVYSSFWVTKLQKEVMRLTTYAIPICQQPVRQGMFIG